MLSSSKSLSAGKHTKNSRESVFAVCCVVLSRQRGIDEVRDHSAIILDLSEETLGSRASL